MLIALIDDGINAVPYPEVNLKYDLTVEDNGTIKERTASDTILTDHGTTCARIIAKYAPGAEFCSLRIFHKEKLRTSCGQFVAALEWCLNSRIPIIHMSVGSSLLSDYQKIRPIVARILRQHQILVAAHSNIASYSIPACLGGVISVIADSQLTNDEYEVLFSTSGLVTIKASSNHKLISSSGNQITTQITNSYAAPTITARVHNLLSSLDRFSLSSIQVFKLLSNSDLNPQYINPDYLDNAIVLNPYGYPINKARFFFRTAHNDQNMLDKSTRFDVVYLAPPGTRSADRIWTDLLAKENLFENVLIGGSKHLSQGQMKWRGFFWSEDVARNREYRTGFLHADMVCPIVNVYGSGIGTIDLLCELRDMFFADGFQCRCLCDHPFAYLYGVDFVANSNNWRKAIEEAMFTYNPDLLINCFRTKTPSLVSSKCGEFHIVVEYLSAPRKIDSIPLRDNLITLTPGFMREDIVSVRQRISQYFA